MTAREYRVYLTQTRHGFGVLMVTCKMESAKLEKEGKKGERDETGHIPSWRSCNERIAFAMGATGGEGICGTAVFVASIAEARDGPTRGRPSAVMSREGRSAGALELEAPTFEGGAGCDVVSAGTISIWPSGGSTDAARSKEHLALRDVQWAHFPSRCAKVRQGTSSVVHLRHPGSCLRAVCKEGT